MGITKKTIIEFGIGDIRITPSPLELGVIGFKQENVIKEIGTKEPIKDTYSQNEEEVLQKVRKVHSFRGGMDSTFIL